MKKIKTIFCAIYVASILLTSCGEGKKTLPNEEKNNVSSFDTTGLPSIDIDDGWDKEQSLKVVYGNFVAYHAAAYRPFG